MPIDQTQKQCEAVNMLKGLLSKATVRAHRAPKTVAAGVILHQGEGCNRFSHAPVISHPALPPTMHLTPTIRAPLTPRAPPPPRPIRTTHSPLK